MIMVDRHRRADVQAAAWAAASRMKFFGYSEIAVEMHISHEMATRFVRAWSDEGRLIALQAGPGLRKLWRADPAWKPVPVKQGRTADLNLWTGMRGLGSFTARDLAAHASTEEVPVGVDYAQGYCRALLASGHLKVVRKAVPGRAEAVYRLARNTGPRPPRERRVVAVIDDNTDAVVVIGGVQK